MPKFEVNITRTITDRYIVTANDEDEAQEIATYGELVLAADKEIYR